MLEKILEDIIKKSFCVEIRDYESDTVVLLDTVEEILKKHMNDGWIPVEERLPEIESVYDVSIINGKGESVVCTWQFLAGIHVSVRQTYVDGVHYWASNYSGDPINEYLSQNVVAWRERPKPYRSERKEK